MDFDIIEINLVKTIIFFGRGGGQREGYGGHIWPKTPKMALISEYLAADSSPDASEDTLAIINIRQLTKWKYL